jgi:hypothetical protein
VNILHENLTNLKTGLSDIKNKLLGQKKKRLELDGFKKINFDMDNNNTKRKDIGLIKKDQTYSLYRVTSGKLKLKLNENQMKSLNKLNGLCGIKTNKGEDSTKSKEYNDTSIKNYNNKDINLNENDEKEDIKNNKDSLDPKGK